MRSLSEAVAAGDLDELIRMVDGLCAAREWDRVIELRDRCRHALEQRGLQLWPAAEYAEYRLALEAPGPIAATVVETDAGRFALGPLWEVAASTHAWVELRDHLPPGPAAALCANDRVMRGEDLTSDQLVDSRVLELPLVVSDWEPRYPVATFRSDEADFPGPVMPSPTRVGLPDPAPAVEDDESIDALLDVASVWAQQSNGSARAVAVAGSAEEAIATLGFGECDLAVVDPAEAMALIAWAASSGGAYGRRRGSATGRFIAWWLVATLADLEWPPDPATLEAAATAMRWVVWEVPGTVGGWSCCIAVEARGHGLAWALQAGDDWREEDDPGAA